MKAHVLLRAESISRVITPKNQTGSILNILWSVNLALATFVALKFIQEMHLASHRVMHRNYRMHQKLLVLGLLDSVQLLDMGHHVYFDNYYNSPDLIDLLHKRKMHACGTVRKNRKSLPLAVTQAKLKQGETVFCHKNNLLALKWMDKREVYILSGLHKATNVLSKKTNYKGQKVTKLQTVFLYNRYMSGVDLTDQFLQYCSFLHKSVKWSKKFFVYCLNMVILNAHILHKKYSDSKKCIDSSG